MKINNLYKFFLVGLIVLITCISFFGLFIIQDCTSDTNIQIPSLSLKNPGFSCNLLEIKTSDSENECSIIQKLLFGCSQRFVYEPITQFKLIDKETFIIKLIDGRSKLIKVENLESKIIKNNIEKRIFYMGTDVYGRDITSRIVMALRISLFIGLVSVILSTIIGVTIGVISGFFGGYIDMFMVYLINVSWSLPTIVYALAIILVLGRGIGSIILAIGLTMWVDMARIIRGEVATLRNNNYVVVSKLLGEKSISTIIKDILPNVIHLIVVIAAANFATAILVESGLSYLGLGVQAPKPSLGNIISENYGYVFSGRYYLALVPISTIVFLVLLFNLLGSAFSESKK